MLFEKMGRGLAVHLSLWLLKKEPEVLISDQMSHLQS